MTEPSGAQRAERCGSGWLQTVTQLAALLAGLAAVIYATGAVVLSLRLEFEHLPWTNVVSQLPRELVLSAGAGQVLLPSLLVGVLYGLYRILREKLYRIRGRDLPSPPAPHGPRDRGRLATLALSLVAVLAMFVPLALVVGTRVFSDRLHPHTGRIWGVLAVLAVAAIDVAVLQEIRAAVIESHRSRRSWNSLKAGAVMAGIYSVAAVPAIMAAAAAIPLTEVKVCTTDNREVTGVLVGEASDRVYIGERGQPPRRIAVLPFSKVETMFVGGRAARDRCAPSLAPVPRVADSGS